MKGFRPVEVIRAKRDGKEIDAERLSAFIEGLGTGGVESLQAAAFAMAVFFRGLTTRETAALAGAMSRSGTQLVWARDAYPGPVIDKHSTGGLGDLVTLVLVPMLAACGGYVPTITGRALAHTGGTLDKLDSVPGFCALLEASRIQEVVREAGGAIVGQTDELAPADRQLYAIRDISGSAECRELVVSSIVGKKVAAGLDHLIFDVKTGNGALLEGLEEARALASMLVEVGGALGLDTVAMMTNMDQPLASFLGNALEVEASIDFLVTPPSGGRLKAVVMGLGACLLTRASLAKSEAEAMEKLERVLYDGSAAERFSRIIALQGGPTDLIESRAKHFPGAPLRMEVRAQSDGTVTAMNCRSLGRTVIGLGGGRLVSSDRVDLRVGLELVVSLGDSVRRGDLLARVHAADEARGSRAVQEVGSAISLGGEGSDAFAPPPLFGEVLTPEGLGCEVRR